MNTKSIEKSFTTMLSEVKQEQSFKVGDKVIKDAKLCAMHTRSAVLLTARRIGDKAMCKEVALLATDDVKKVGFKSIPAYLREVFQTDLTAGQINDYIRVGKIFADKESAGYKWKSAIPQDVTLTNLRDVLSLVFEECNGKDEKDVLKLSDSELNRLYDRFVSIYVEGDNPAPLQASNAYLRDWKKSLKEDAEAIPTTATEVPEGDAEEVQEQEQEQENVTEDVIRENAKVALSDLMSFYRDNADIEKAVCDLLALIG